MTKLGAKGPVTAHIILLVLCDAAIMLIRSEISNACPHDGLIDGPVGGCVGRWVDGLMDGWLLILKTGTSYGWKLLSNTLHLEIVFI